MRHLLALVLLTACSLPRRQLVPVEPLAMRTVIPPTCTQVQVTVGPDRVMRVMPGTPTITPGTAVAVIVQKDQRSTTTTTVAVSTTTTTTRVVTSTTTTSTSMSSSTTTTLPTAVVTCGNAATPLSTVGFWGQGLSASTGCVTGPNPTGYAVQDARIYLGALDTPFALRLGVYSGSTLLCQSSLVTAGTGNAWNTVLLVGCGTLSPNMPYGLALLFGSDKSEVGDGNASPCTAPVGILGTNFYTMGESVTRPLPTSWTPGQQDGCLTSIYLTLVPK